RPAYPLQKVERHVPERPPMGQYGRIRILVGEGVDANLHEQAEDQDHDEPDHVLSRGPTAWWWDEVGRLVAGVRRKLRRCRVVDRLRYRGAARSVRSLVGRRVPRHSGTRRYAPSLALVAIDAYARNAAEIGRLRSAGAYGRSRFSCATRRASSTSSG